MKIRPLLFVLCAAIALSLLLPVSGASARDELKNTDPEKYYIVLDMNNQIVTVYEKDDSGEYTRIVRRMLCTTGRTELDPLDPEDLGTPTPKGIWKIGARERFGKFTSFSGEYARYWTQLVDGVFFHSSMFSARDINKMKSGPHGGLGNKGSHGCIRLYVEDAKWLYYNACPGTTVFATNGMKRNATLARSIKNMPFKQYFPFQKTFYNPPELPNLKAWVVVEDAPLRTGNGSNDHVIMKLKPGTEIEILQEGDPWVKALVDGKREGYMKRAYITYEKGVMQSREDGFIMKVTDEMYVQPDTDSDVICKVPHDVSLIILEPDKDGWTKIRYFNEEGYILTKNIKSGWATIYD